MEFYTGYAYETRDRKVMICLKHDAPSAYHPIVMMKVEDGMCRNYKSDGLIYSFSESGDDIVLMLPFEPDYDLIANSRLVQENIEIIKQLKKIEHEAIHGAPLEKTPILKNRFNQNTLFYLIMGCTFLVLALCLARLLHG